MWLKWYVLYYVTFTTIKKFLKSNFLAYTLEVLIEAVKLSSRNSCYNLLSRVYESISSDTPLTTLDIIFFSPYLRAPPQKKTYVFLFGFAFPHYQYLRTLLHYAVRLNTCSYVIRHLYFFCESLV